ncbi:helix-turn-helix domain-containing protein [Paenibacillus terreus]|uniref:Helix-turn-helix domain-containing protein n=1 Tax=Paenibacillus terreus TaxID=1387834 RepID=A0ABV5BCX3_9BACL
MTQDQLAEVLDSQGSYIGRVERGEQNLQLQTLEKIAEALHTEVTVTFGSKQTAAEIEEKWIEEIAQLLRGRSVQEQERAYRVLRELFI